MKNPRTIYVTLLYVAAVIYVIGVCLLQADLYGRIGKLEHASAHAATGGRGH